MVIYADTDSKPTFELERYDYVEKAKKMVSCGIHTHAGQPDDHPYG
jgi:hypothetical protein